MLCNESHFFLLPLISHHKIGDEPVTTAMMEEKVVQIHPVR